MKNKNVSSKITSPPSKNAPTLNPNLNVPNHISLSQPEQKNTIPLAAIFGKCISPSSTGRGHYEHLAQY